MLSNYRHEGMDLEKNVDIDLSSNVACVKKEQWCDFVNRKPLESNYYLSNFF